MRRITQSSGPVQPTEPLTFAAPVLFSSSPLLPPRESHPTLTPPLSERSRSKTVLQFARKWFMNQLTWDWCTAVAHQRTILLSCEVREQYLLSTGEVSPSCPAPSTHRSRRRSRLIMWAGGLSRTPSTARNKGKGARRRFSGPRRCRKGKHEHEEERNKNARDLDDSFRGSSIVRKWNKPLKRLIEVFNVS